MPRVSLIQFAVGTSTSRDGADCMITKKGETGITLYGPYEDKEPGRYRVTFEVGLADATSPLGDPVAMILDVRTNHGHTLVAEKYVLYSHLEQGLAEIEVEFELQEPRKLEYRVIVGGQVPIVAAQDVTVERIGDSRRIARSKGPQEQAWENEREFLDGFLRNVSGLIHVGANLGQERRYYWLIGLDVIWVEPIREIYEKLVDNISPYPRQRAINALLTSRAGEQIELQIANNNGASSSVLPLQDHAVIFPEITYVEKRMITSTTLADMITSERIPLENYQALTLDVEGAEKMVLEGAGDFLRNFAYIKCEVADFPARTGTPTVADLDRMLEPLGFRQLIRKSFAEGPGKEGTFWDIVWKRIVPGELFHESGYVLPIAVDPLEVVAIEKCE